MQQQIQDLIKQIQKELKLDTSIQVPKDIQVYTYTHPSGDTFRVTCVLKDTGVYVSGLKAFECPNMEEALKATSFAIAQAIVTQDLVTATSNRYF